MNKLSKLKYQLEVLQEMIKLEEDKQEAEKNKRDYIYVDKFKCYILPEVILKNKTFEQQKAEIPSGCEIASYEIIQYCRNNNLHKCFKEFWVNVPNPDKISENNNYVAGFDADSGRADLSCDWSPTNADDSLGVFAICRKKLKTGYKLITDNKDFANKEKIK